MSNLVDSIMQELDQNNTQNDVNYQPEMVYNDNMQETQPRQQYMQQIPQQQQQMPQQQQMYQMPSPDMQQQQGGAQYQMKQQQQQHTITPESDEVDAPNLEGYGMDEDTSSASLLNTIIDEAKLPLIVMILTFIITIPQVGQFVRGNLFNLLNNSLYVNIAVSVLMGVVFYAIVKFLV